MALGQVHLPAAEQGAPSSEFWGMSDRAYGGANGLSSPEVDPPLQGVVGFFHPFAEGGGGGERVLW